MRTFTLPKWWTQPGTCKATQTLIICMKEGGSTNLRMKKPHLKPQITSCFQDHRQQLATKEETISSLLAIPHWEVVCPAKISPLMALKLFMRDIIAQAVPFLLPILKHISLTKKDLSISKYLVKNRCAIHSCPTLTINTTSTFSILRSLRNSQWSLWDPSLIWNRMSWLLEDSVRS